MTMSSTHFLSGLRAGTIESLRIQHLATVVQKSMNVIEELLNFKSTKPRERQWTPSRDVYKWTLLTVIVLGEQFSFWGVLLAVPVAAVIKVVIEELWPFYKVSRVYQAAAPS